MEKQEGKKSNRPTREVVIFEDRYDPNCRNDH